jgi:methylase of polypeptide subunit release factors
MQIDTVNYLKLAAAPERLLETLDIHVTEHAFLPSVDEILGDWVATIAMPAFKLIRARQGAQPAFCSIGTGVGLDALAAIETLGVTRVGITDVHDDVVAAAAANIRRNLKNPDGVALAAGSGDLLEPLRSGNGTGQPRYDLIYENLPNIPVGDGEEAASARKSSSLVPARREAIPDLMRRNLLALHYVALQKAKEFLAPGGAVLSLIGGRIPLDVFREMGNLAGYRCEIFTYGWKLQTDAEEILTRYVRLQEEGFGPYHFYRAERLAAAFAGLCPEDSGKKAHEIERTLAPDELSPAAVLDAWRRGEAVGHTVVALRSVPE